MYVAHDLANPTATYVPEELDELHAQRRGHKKYKEWLSSEYTAEMRRRKDYYDGTQVVQNASLLEQVDTITPDTWRSTLSGPGWDNVRAMLPDATKESIVQPMTINLTPVIINNRQVVYMVPAKRRDIVKDGKKDEEASKTLAVLMKGCRHDLISDQLCKWTGLFATAFQMVTFDERYNRLKKTNLEPWRVHVIPSAEAPDDIQHPDCCVAISQNVAWESKQDKTDGGRTVWQVWWRDLYWYETVENQPFMDPDCTEPGVNVNPYTDVNGESVKPIIVTHENITTQIHDPGSDMIVLQNQAIDRHLTAVGNTMEFQGFGVPVFTGTTVEEVAAQGYAPASPIVLRDDQAKFSFEHPAAPVSEFVAAVNRMLKMFARLQSVDPDMVDSESKIQSGVSRALSRMALTERREQEFPKWLEYEWESMWLCAIIWNTHTKSKKKLPTVHRFPTVDETVTMECEFGDLEPVVDPLADSIAIKGLMDLGVVSLPEVIAAKRRISITAAEHVAEIVKKQNDKYRPATLLDMARAAGPGGPPRIGQNGNRPMNEDKEPSRAGGNTTAFSGNQKVGAQGPQGAK